MTLDISRVLTFVKNLKLDTLSIQSSILHKHTFAVVWVGAAGGRRLQGGATRSAEAAPRPDLAGVTAAGNSGPAQPRQHRVDLGALPAATQTAAFRKKKKKKETHIRLGLLHRWAANRLRSAGRNHRRLLCLIVQLSYSDV